MRTEKEIRNRLAVITDSIISKSDINYKLKSAMKYCSIALLKWILGESKQDALDKAFEAMDIDEKYSD